MQRSLAGLGLPLANAWPASWGGRDCRQSSNPAVSGIGGFTKPIGRSGWALHGLGREWGQIGSREPTPMAGGQRSTISSGLCKQARAWDELRKAPRRHVSTGPGHSDSGPGRRHFGRAQFWFGPKPILERTGAPPSRESAPGLSPPPTRPITVCCVIGSDADLHRGRPGRGARPFRAGQQRRLAAGTGGSRRGPAAADPSADLAVSYQARKPPAVARFVCIEEGGASPGQHSVGSPAGAGNPVNPALLGGAPGPPAQPG